MKRSRVTELPSFVANILLVWAAALAIRVVVAFFGGIAIYPFPAAFLQVTRAIVVPFGAGTVTSPYGGSFLADTALTMLLLLVVEWAISSRAMRSANR
ncbi:MAG: hypothetical protein AB2L09_03810 [Coriobacteriia bacterium]